MTLLEPLGRSLGCDALGRREPDLEREVDLDLAVEAANLMSEAGFGRGRVLGAAVGAEKRRVHGPRIRPSSAYRVALRSARAH